MLPELRHGKGISALRPSLGFLFLLLLGDLRDGSIGGDLDALAVGAHFALYT